MSIKQFLSKIWAGIKELFAKLPVEAKDAVHLAVSITERLKAFVDSPVADLVTALIPGKTDDLIKERLRNALPNILQALRIADATISSDRPQEIILSAMETLKKSHPDIINAHLHSLSVMLTRFASDDKIKWSDAVALVEWYYQNKFKPAA